MMPRRMIFREFRTASITVRFSLATGIAVAALAITLLVDPVMSRAPSAPLFAAVLVIGWLVGFGPAVFATALGVTVLGYLVGEPLAHWRFDRRDFFWLALVFLTIIGMAWLASAVRRLEDERARLLEREREARAAAEVANRAKNDFLAIVSHELRSPLTSILGWVHLLKTGTLGLPEARQALETIQRNTVFQAKLIDDLLDVSRAIAGKFDVVMRPVDLADLIRDVVHSLHPKALSAGLVLEVRLEPLPVLGDPARLAQVVTNLLSNAMKFTPAGGRIEIDGRRAGASVRIIVRDTGEGIEPAALPHVFDRFHQATGRRNEGLGLGLAIAKHIVEAHGGSISAESQGRACGATFTITLPLRT